MRVLRSAVTLALALTLLALPLGTAAQESEPALDSGEDLPLALQPDGRLPLEGTPWRLSGYRWKGDLRQPGPEVAATLRLSVGALRASGGCTDFRGSYGVAGSAISFAPRKLGDNDCAEQTTMVQLGLVDGLRKAASFEIAAGADEADQLVLHSAIGNELLRFKHDQVGALEVGEWQLEAYASEGERTAATSDQAAVMSFDATDSNEAQRTNSGRLTASSGCNAVIADYYQHADVMSFGPLELTDAPCLPEVTAQEAAMVAVLDATALRAELSPDHLTLTSLDTGDSLELMSTSPLEGSTWVLAKFPVAGEPTENVALWLDDGRVSGEGPCGSISASYATDGYFLTFSEVAGEADEECPAAAAEKALLAAMRTVVRLDRDQPQLRMLDAFGAIVLRFKAPRRP